MARGKRMICCYSAKVTLFRTVLYKNTNWLHQHSCYRGLRVSCIENWRHITGGVNCKRMIEKYVSLPQDTRMFLDYFEPGYKADYAVRSKNDF